MPEYDYRCPKCDQQFSQFMGIKSYEQDQRAECPYCDCICQKEDRDYSKTKLTFIGTQVKDAEYNPGLGCVVKDDYHKSELLKKKNLVEVGNDFGTGEKMQTHFEKEKKEEIEKKWDKEPNDFFL